MGPGSLHAPRRRSLQGSPNVSTHFANQPWTARSEQAHFFLPGQHGSRARVLVITRSVPSHALPSLLLRHCSYHYSPHVHSRSFVLRTILVITSRSVLFCCIPRRAHV